MLRAKACEKVVTVGLSTHPKALERAANENEQNSRANARVCDTFHIALPKEMSAEERIATTRSFLFQLTDGGRAKAFAAFHGTDTHNPHIHVMFFDRDEDGKRVQAMSERGSTEKMRILWERVCNSKLALESPETPLEVEAGEATLAPMKMSAIEEDYLRNLSPEEVAELGDAHIEREYQSTAQRIEDALEYDAEFQRLQDIQSEIENLKVQAERAKQAAEEFEREATQLFLEAQEAEKDKLRAETELAPLKRRSGRLRGFQFKIFGLEVVSPTRQKAIEAADKVRFSEWLKTIKDVNAQAVEHQAAIQKNEAAHYESRQEAANLELLRHLHETYGEDTTLKKAEYLHVKSISVALAGVEPQQIYAEYENGALTAEQAIRAFELTGDVEMINAVEQRDRQERQQEAANDNGVEI
jgi:hypothetical protein